MTCTRCKAPIEPGAQPEMVIRVYGLPAPQGSKRHVGHGVMIESSKAVKPWREAVKWAALAVGVDFPAMPFTGPTLMVVTFTMPRPKSAKRGAQPSKKPDLSKLVRSTEDAITDAGVWEDDARVVRCIASKVYPGQCEDSLESPGAVIRISNAEGL